MEAVLQWGLDCIRLVQSYASTPLTVIMRIITTLGAAPLYIVVLPFVYWCVSEKKGLHLGIMLLISVWINISLKYVLDQPRPFFEGYDPSVGMIPETMGGFPSGHAQNSLVMVMMLAAWGKKKVYSGCAVFICLLIGFSRIYLGVHFPTDVVGGWIIGAVLLCAYVLLAGRVETVLARGGFRLSMIAGAALSFMLILYLPSRESLISGGTILGLSTGYCLNRRYIFFTSRDLSGRTGAAKYLTLFVRFALGLTCMFLIFVVIGKLNLGNLFSASARLIAFMQFALTGLWVSAGAPWLFCRLRLAVAPRQKM